MVARIAGVLNVSGSSARFAVVDVESRTELETRRYAAEPVSDGPYPHFPVEDIWEFLLASIDELNRLHSIDALCVTTLGATAALVDEAGRLALPVLDPNHSGPDALSSEYAELRPDFGETFSPRLPGGRNLGAQLYWQSRIFPNEFAATRWILPFPQFWGYRLTDVAASEPTSLGWHTDLWNPETDLYSSLVLRQGWLDRMPEVRPAAHVLGTVRPDVCGRMGLKPRIPVHVGIQQDNAALLPHLLSHVGPFAVVSTGREIGILAPGGNLEDLDPHGGGFAGIDALGRPVPGIERSGGWEHALLVNEAPPRHIGEAAIARVLEDEIMLLPPSEAEDTRGPHWNRPSALIDDEARFVAASFHCALTTARYLERMGADGPIIVEGPLAANRHYLDMMVAATDRPVEATTSTPAGPTIGAALLARMERAPSALAQRPPTPATRPLSEYAAKWRSAVGE